MKNWKFGVCIIITSLLLGSLIYFITRTEATILNHWLAKAGGESILLSFQNLVDNTSLPHWVIYSLPDGLWMLALATSIMMIWHYELNLSSIAFTVLAGSAGAIFEVLQGMNVIKGTFDWSDLFFVTAASVLPVSFTILKTRLCKK